MIVAVGGGDALVMDDTMTLSWMTSFELPFPLSSILYLTAVFMLCVTKGLYIV